MTASSSTAIGPLLRYDADETSFAQPITRPVRSSIARGLRPRRRARRHDLAPVLALLLLQLAGPRRACDGAATKATGSSCRSASTPTASPRRSPSLSTRSRSAASSPRSRATRAGAPSSTSPTARMPPTRGRGRPTGPGRSQREADGEGDEVRPPVEAIDDAIPPAVSDERPSARSRLRPTPGGSRARPARCSSPAPRRPAADHDREPQLAVPDVGERVLEVDGRPRLDVAHVADQPAGRRRSRTGRRGRLALVIPPPAAAPGPPPPEACFIGADQRADDGDADEQRDRRRGQRRHVELGGRERDDAERDEDDQEEDRPETRIDGDATARSSMPQDAAPRTGSGPAAASGQPAAPAAEAPRRSRRTRGRCRSAGRRRPAARAPGSARSPATPRSAAAPAPPARCRSRG